MLVVASAGWKRGNWEQFIKPLLLSPSVLLFSPPRQLSWQPYQWHVPSPWWQSSLAVERQTHTHTRLTVMYLKCKAGDLLSDDHHWPIGETQERRNQNHINLWSPDCLRSHLHWNELLLPYHIQDNIPSPSGRHYSFTGAFGRTAVARPSHSV